MRILTSHVKPGLSSGAVLTIGLFILTCMAGGANFLAPSTLAAPVSALPAESVQLPPDAIAAIREALSHATQTASMEDPEFFRDETLDEIAAFQIRVGDWDGALATANKVVSWRRSGVLRRLARARVRTGDLSATQGLVEGVPDDRKDNVRVGIFEGLVEIGDIPRAVNAAQSVKAEELRAYAAHEIAQAQIKSGDLQGAMRTLRVRPRPEDKPQPSVPPLHDPQFFELPRAGLHMKDWLPKDELVLGDLAGVQIGAGDTEGALRTVNLLHGPAVQAWFYTLTALVQVKHGETKKAQEPLWEALQKVEYLPDHVKNYILAMIAEVQAKAGYLDAARQTVKNIEEPRRRARALTAIAVAHTKAGNLQAALQAAEEIRDDRADDEIGREVGYKFAVVEIGREQIDRGDFGGALETLKRVESKMGMARDVALSETAHAKARLGDVQGALRVAGESGMLAYRRIARVQAEAGQVKEAYAWATALDSLSEQAAKSRPVLESRALNKAMAFLGIAEGICVKHDPECLERTDTDVTDGMYTVTFH